MSKNNISSEYYTETKHIIINNKRRLYNFIEVKMDRSSEFVGYAEDITQLEELNNKPDSYITTQKTLLENLPVAVVIYDCYIR